MNQNKRKSSNPLYAVTNNGEDVELAEGIWDLFLKKVRLEKWAKLFEEVFLNIFLEIFSHVKSYATFMIIKEMMDDFINQMEIWYGKIYKEKL